MIINKQGSSLLPGLKVFDLVNRQLLPPVLAFLLTAWPRLVLLFILQVDETGAAQQFSAEEVSLRLTWAWGLSPVSLQWLPAFPQVVSNLFPVGKGLRHNVFAWRRDILMGPLPWLQVSGCQPTWGAWASACSSLSQYCSKGNSKMLVANEDPPVRGPMPCLRQVLWILIINPELPMDQYCLDQYCRGDETIPFFTICLGTSFAHESLRTSRRGINKETTNLYYSVRMKQRLNIAISNLLQENRKEQEGIRGSLVCPLSGPVRWWLGMGGMTFQTEGTPWAKAHGKKECRVYLGPGK